MARFFFFVLLCRLVGGERGGGKPCRRCMQCTAVCGMVVHVVHGYTDAKMWKEEEMLALRLTILKRREKGED